MVYYKVVSQNLCSSQVGQNESTRKIVQYKIGEYVTAPDDTRLFVFSDLAEAKEFARCSSDKVFECKCIGVIKYKPASSLTAIQEYWRYINSVLKKKKKLGKDRKSVV